MIQQNNRNMMLNRVKNYNKNETERLADNARNLEILIQKFI